MKNKRLTTCLFLSNLYILRYSELSSWQRLLLDNNAVLFRSQCAYIQIKNKKRCEHYTVTVMQHDENTCYDNNELNGCSSNQTPVSSLSSIVMETGEQGDKMSKERSCGRGRRRRRRNRTEDEKRKSNRFDLTGPDR